MNAQAKNTKTAGNTEKFFQQMHSIISVNDGKRQAGSVVENAFSQAVPFRFDQKTDLLITTNSYDVVNLRKGFITAHLTFSISLQSLEPTAAFNDAFWNDQDRLGKLFIGYKASNQAVRELQVYCNNAATKYHTKYVVQEGFAYSTLKSWSMRDKKRYVHSLYENAKSYMPDVAGTYVDIQDFIDGQPHDVRMEINIPIVDFLGLQAFDKWIKEFGELFLEMYFSERSLVVTTCDPSDIWEQKRYLEGDAVKTQSLDCLTGAPGEFEHRFTQIEDPFVSFVGVEFKPATPSQPGNGTSLPVTFPLAGTPAVASFSVGKIIAHCHSATCTDLTSTIRGYNITERAKRSILAAVAADPLVIPAQELLFYPFPSGPNSNGIHSNINVPYQNVTDVTVVFPKTSHQITCYENPMLENLQLTIAGQFYPKKAYSTFGSRFLQEQLIIADLDGSLQATKEYTESIVNERNHPSNGDRWNNSLGDDTSFMALFQTERGDGGYVYDGLDTAGANVNTEITGMPSWSGTGTGGPQDTYLYPYTRLDGSVDTNIRSPPPQLWQAVDTFFVIDSKGLTYHNRSSPNQSQSSG
jgi:hypothetical protein